MDIIKNGANQIILRLSRLFADSSLPFPAITVGAALCVMAIAVLICIRIKIKKRKGISDSKFSVVEELSYSQSAQIITRTGPTDKETGTRYIQ